MHGNWNFYLHVQQQKIKILISEFFNLLHDKHRILYAKLITN